MAIDFAAKAKKKGINAKVVGLEQYRLTDLPKEEYFFTVISTQGDGEPPAAAKKFYDHIHKESLQLAQLKYSVLALGDTSYPLFCKAGEDVDQQFQRMGGQRAYLADMINGVRNGIEKGVPGEQLAKNVDLSHHIIIRGARIRLETLRRSRRFTPN